MTTVMTAKDLHIATKRPDGISYLMERFEFSEEAELFDTIRKVSPTKAESFIKTLQKKQKQFNKRAKNNSEISEGEDEVEVQQEQLVAQPSEEIVYEENDDEKIDQEEQIVPTVEENSDEETDGNEKCLSDTPTLEQLIAQEKELSSKICEVEVKHNEYRSERRKLISKLENYEKALDELRRILRMQEEDSTRIYQAYLDFAVLMDELNEEKKKYMKMRDDIKRKIDDMKRINIFVYENASFEVENIPIEPIADSEVTSQSMKLFALPEADELTGKEMKNIAKLQLVVELIERNGYKTELVFDSERVQKFWETVIIA